MFPRTFQRSFLVRSFVPYLLALIAFLPLGCQEPSMRSVAERAEKAQQKKTRKILTPENSKFHKPKPTPASASPETMASLERSFEATRATQVRTGTPETVAVQNASRAINAGLETGPTLAIWLFDQSQSANRLVTDASLAARGFYESNEIQQLPQSPEPQLLTVVAGFGPTVTLLTEQPTSDLAALQQAFASAPGNDSKGENTFAAITSVLNQFASYRMEQGRQVVLIVVTDEAGDDLPQADKAVELAEKLTIPVYVVGTPAPWGQTNPFLARARDMKVNTDLVEEFPTYGPDSRYSERVDVAPWTSGYNYGESDLELVDSGFGPFALEWICRASGGQFFPVRGESFSVGRFGVSNWPSSQASLFEPDVVRRYAPDYVSEARYQKLLADNKARMALHEAAKLPPIKIDGQPNMRFPKGNEAETVRRLNVAQQFAARHAPPIDRVYDVLARGEGDREKLTEPRWQAEFDLAMGRVLAAKVRIDGYNSMIAALKRGKTFENESSTEWYLEQNETIETGSAMQKLADKARMYLNRVIKEHPGTPWAKIAERELKTPLGWQWKEA